MTTFFHLCSDSFEASLWSRLVFHFASICLGKPFNSDNMCLPLPVTGFPRPGCFCSLGKNNRQVSSFFGRVSSRVNNKHELRKYKYVGPDSDEKSNVKMQLNASLICLFILIASINGKFNHFPLNSFKLFNFCIFIFSKKFDVD